MKTITSLSTILFLGICLILNSCANSAEESTKKAMEGAKETIQTAAKKATYPSDVISFFNDFSLILGDGSNVGPPVNFENKDFFYAKNDGKTDWVVYRAHNAGNTHGTSNNIRTELAQNKKWSPMTPAKLTATCKVMNVSGTGDPRVAATHSVVIGQIHSADGHENEPLKIFYKKFPGHKKGSIFWNYEINTKGDDNGGRWDYSYPVWGYDFSVVSKDGKTFPAEPKDGIELGEEITYEVELKGDGIMHVKFTSKGHETKTFSKNLIKSEYTKASDMPAQVKGLFVPIGQDGVEREKAYTGEGLFFKQGAYNQTNGKSPDLNGVWCSGAETNGGDLKKQMAAGNYAEVWFKSSSIEISDKSISNKEYFTNNDFLQLKQQQKEKK